MANIKDQLPADTINYFCSSEEEALAGKWSNRWKVLDGLLTIVCHVYVPTSSAHVQALLEAAHDIGHEGIEKTLHHLRADFHIPSAQTAMQ
jgi:hypothetical protein